MDTNTVVIIDLVINTMGIFVVDIDIIEYEREPDIEVYFDIR